jgi:hypothetical protein
VKPKELEYLAEVLSMLLQVLAIDKNVVEEYEDKLPEVLGEDVIHQMLECSWSVAQPEWHHQVFVVTKMSTEGRFGNISWIHPDLVISRTEVKFGENCSAMQFI